MSLLKSGLSGIVMHVKMEESKPQTFLRLIYVSSTEKSSKLNKKDPAAIKPIRKIFKLTPQFAPVYHRKHSHM